VMAAGLNGKREPGIVVLRSYPVAIDSDPDCRLAFDAATKKPSLLDNVDERLVGFGLGKSSQRLVGLYVEGYSFRTAGTDNDSLAPRESARSDKNCGQCAFHGFIVGLGRHRRTLHGMAMGRAKSTFVVGQGSATATPLPIRQYAHLVSPPKVWEPREHQKAPRWVGLRVSTRTYTRIRGLS